MNKKILLIITFVVSMIAADNNTSMHSLDARALALEEKKLEIEKMKLELEKEKLKLQQQKAVEEKAAPQSMEQDSGLFDGGYGEWSIENTQSTMKSKENGYTDSKTYDYSLQYTHYGHDFIAFAAYSIAPKQTLAKINMSDVFVSGDQLTAKAEGEGTAYEVGYLPKIYHEGKVFLGPGIIYQVAEVITYVSSYYTYGTTNLSDNSKDTESDTDLSLDLVLGYEYGTKSLATLSYGVSDDLLEEEDQDECDNIDHHTVGVNLVHAVSDKLSLHAGYSQDTDNCNDSVYEKETAMSFGLGYFY